MRISRRDHKHRASRYDRLANLANDNLNGAIHGRAQGQLCDALLKNGEGIVLDIKAKLDRTLKPEGIDLWRL